MRCSLAERVWPWLRAPVPPRYWRKVVAAIQGVSLAVVVSGLLPTAESMALLFAALVLLAESFGQDIVWLTRETPSGPPCRVRAGNDDVTTHLARSAGG